MLKRTIESLVTQTLDRSEYEVVVIDDGSFDNTKDVVRVFSERLNMRYFYQRNTGLASARNHGIFAARGEIILFFDDDDVATQNLLEEHIKTHERYPDENYAVLHHTAWSPDIRVTPLMHFITEVGCFLFAYPYMKHGEILDYTRFWGGRISCKRSFLLKHGVFNPIFKFGNEDTELGYRLSRHGLRVVYNANAVAYMIRPIDFLSFCRRLLLQGRANFICSRLHSDPSVQEWCEVKGVEERWRRIEAHFGRMVEVAKRLDKAFSMIEDRGYGIDDRAREHLHKAYWRAFQACKVKGIIDAGTHEGVFFSNSNDQVGWRRVSRKTGKELICIAIICAYNEGDIIYFTLKHLIDNGIMVYLMDHNSTDNTVEEASKWLGKGLLRIERFPQESGFPEDLTEKFALRFITKRVEQLHKELGADWYMHYDADEFRESPWAGMSLIEAIELVDHLGYNAIDFEVLNFRPTDNSYQGGEDVRKYLRYYEPAEEFNKMQIKAWKNFGQDIELSSTGGHSATFKDRRVFPVKFITLHFPIRNQEHGMRKVFVERIKRFDRREKSIGWHLQYDSLIKKKNFIYDKKELFLYNPQEVRNRIWTEAIINLHTSATG